MSRELGGRVVVEIDETLKPCELGSWCCVHGQGDAGCSEGCIHLAYEQALLAAGTRKWEEGLQEGIMSRKNTETGKKE